MPIRLGKSMRRQLKSMAIKQLRGIRVNFLFDELTALERKAIRQLAKDWERDHELVPNITMGPERTPLRPWPPEQVVAYRRMRLAGAENSVESTAPEAGAESAAPDDWDSFFLEGPTVSEDFER
jgi:hypothetical protein